MAFSEGELRATGDPADAAYADVIAAILASRGEDIPLPVALQAAEEQTDSEIVTPASVLSGVVEIETYSDIDREYTARTHLSKRVRDVAQSVINDIGTELLLAPEPKRMHRLLHPQKLVNERKDVERIGPVQIEHTRTTTYNDKPGFKVPIEFRNRAIGRVSPELFNTSTLVFDGNAAGSISIRPGDSGRYLAFLDTQGYDMEPIIALQHQDFSGTTITVHTGVNELGVTLQAGFYSGKTANTESKFVYVPDENGGRFEEQFVRGYNKAGELRILTPDDFLRLTSAIISTIPKRALNTTAE